MNAPRAWHPLAATGALVAALAAQGIEGGQVGEGRPAGEAAIASDTVRVLARAAVCGGLDGAALARALTSPDAELAEAAARVLRHAVAEVPDEVHAALAGSATARRALLAELAVAPRPAFEPFVVEQAQSADATNRLLALAARAAPPSRDEAAFVLASLAADADRTAMLPCARIEPPIADGLVARLHQHLDRGLPLDRVQPFLERLSPIGVRQLLSLSLTLPEEPAAALVDVLARRSDRAFAERVRAMLDGELPMQASWLRRCKDELGDEVRRSRVAAVCARGAEPTATESEVAMAVAAFESLLDAGIFEPALVHFARAGGPDRWRLLLQTSLRGVPRAGIADELDLDGLAPRDAAMLLRALAGRRHPWTTALEQKVVAFAARELGDGSGRGLHSFAAALRVLATAGGDSAAHEAVRFAGRDRDALVAVCEHFAHRRDPVGGEALRNVLLELEGERDPGLDGLRRTILLLLAETGTPVDVVAIARVADSLRASELHRWRVAVKRLPAAAAAELRKKVSAAEPDAQCELLGWLCSADSTEVRSLLLDSLQSPHEEVREAALEALLRTGLRDELLAKWRGEPNADAARDDAYAYALLATLREPWTDRDVEWLAYLLFTAPRRDPRERERARHFRDARAGFPVVGALATHLRRAPERALDVVAVAGDLARRGDVDGLCRQRFLYLYTALQSDPRLLGAVAQRTAELVLAIPDADDVGLGLASHYAAAAAEARGELSLAASRHAVAVERFLLEPGLDVDRRIHLAVREPLAGFDAHAALAAAPHRLRALAAAAAGDVAAARRELGLAREFAGRDAATLRAVEALAKELP